jgi:hypothetical protein
LDDCNRIARSTIGDSCEDKPASNIEGIEEATTTWEILKKMHGVQDPLVPIIRVGEMTDMTLAGCEDVNQYVSRLGTKRKEIMNMGYEMQEWIVIGIFLKKLTEPYSGEL